MLCLNVQSITVLSFAGANVANDNNSHAHLAFLPCKWKAVSSLARGIVEGTISFMSVFYFDGQPRFKIHYRFR